MAQIARPDLAVFDGWVTDPMLLEQLREIVLGESKEEPTREPPRYRWWNGEAPCSPIHTYIRYTEQRLRSFVDRDFVGFAWRRHVDCALPWQSDAEVSEGDGATFACPPVFSTELCLSSTDVIRGLGGALAVDSDDTGKTADHIYPLWNRLVVFAGNRPRCVREFEGRRLGLAVTFWDRLPQNVDSWNRADAGARLPGQSSSK